jgi:hypothetical protein
VIAVGVLAVSAIVTLRVEATSGVAPDVANRVTEALAQAIESHTGHKTRIATYSDPSGETVVLSFFGGLTKIRLVAERASSLWGPSVRIETELALTPAARQKTIAETAARLFPEGMRPRDEAAGAVVEVAPVKPTSVSPWIACGAGVAMLGGGIAFSAVALSAKHRLSTETLDSPDVTTLDQRMRVDGIVGGVLLTAALGTLAAALMLALGD